MLLFLSFLTASPFMAPISASGPLNFDLVEKAKMGQPPTFEQVLSAKFDSKDQSQFDALRTWAEKLSPEDRAKYFNKIGNGPDEKSIWHDKVPCGQADRTGLTRSMVVAVGNSPNPQTARRVWADAERAYANGLSIEAKNLI